MGLSTTTLHLYGMERAALAALLPPGYLLREQNAPWLDVVPVETAMKPCLEKLAKQATKENGSAAALLFDYFDDDVFQCRLYREGKRTAKCESGGSWAKLGKQLDALFGDRSASGAFRHVSRCADLEEELRLLEQTVGTALLDDAEAPPRTAPRCSDALQTIKAREAKLRRRPNQCTLTELPPEQWPVDWQAQWKLYQRLRPNWRDTNASNLLFGFGNRRFSVPQHPECAVHRCTDREKQERLFCYDLREDVLREQPTPELRLHAPLWITPQGELVCLFTEGYWKETGSGWSFTTTSDTFAACLCPDGTERWRFAPCSGWTLRHAHTSADGIITLYAQRESQGPRKTDAAIYQIDGTTGAHLRTRPIPWAEDLVGLVRVDVCDGFLYIAGQSELVLLNDELEETARWDGYCGGRYPEEEQIAGNVLWSGYDLSLYDLRTGEKRDFTLETPDYLIAMLPDGRFLGVNEKQNRLTVFDPAGRVISRHTAPRPGKFLRARVEAKRVCILEERAPETYGLVSQALFDTASLHVWRLDPATPQGSPAGSD